MNTFDRTEYPQGMMAKDILHEIRKRHGEDAFALCSILDVCDEMTRIYGRERDTPK